MTEQEARIEMGYDPVEKAIKIFSAESVVALWAPTMKQRFRYQIQRYLQRKTGVGARPSFYIRGDGGLIVLEGTELDIPQIEALIQRFGVVEDVYSNLRVIRISIDGERPARAERRAGTQAQRQIPPGLLRAQPGRA